MTSGWRRRFDPLAALPAAIAVTMIGVYLALIRAQGGEVAGLFLGGMAVAALLAVYAVARHAPLRRSALAVSGAVMAVLGFFGILTIGLPILVAGVLALVDVAGSTKPAR
jgi:hypothetical protein